MFLFKLIIKIENSKNAKIQIRLRYFTEMKDFFNISNTEINIYIVFTMHAWQS